MSELAGKALATLLALAGLAVLLWLWRGEIAEKAVLELEHSQLEQLLEEERRMRTVDTEVKENYRHEISELEKRAPAPRPARVVRVCPPAAAAVAAGGADAAGADDAGAAADVLLGLGGADIGEDLLEVERLAWQADQVSAQLRAVLERERRRTARVH